MTIIRPRPHHTSYEDLLVELRSELLRAAYARTSQLAELSPSGADPVRAACRASVRRILDEIHAALDRIEDGSYGACSRCGAPVPLKVLRACPWASSCDLCVGRAA